MRFLFLFLSFGFFDGVGAHASEMNIAAIIRAPSLSNLKLKIKETHHLENIRAQCEIQLKYGMLPSRCFEVIRLEKRDGVISEEKFQETLSWLSENCNERVTGSSDLKLDSRQLSFLPKACREIAERKMGDQRYRDVTMNPTSLFKGRL